MHTPPAERCLHANPDESRKLVGDAMNVMLWTVGVLISFMAVVIAALPLRRRGVVVQKRDGGQDCGVLDKPVRKSDQSSHKLTVGSISGGWLTEYNAKHRQDRS
jgi:hypothetical protein